MSYEAAGSAEPVQHAFRTLFFVSRHITAENGHVCTAWCYYYTCYFGLK